MEEPYDPYAYLRPCAPFAAECTCADRPPVCLTRAIHHNPIHCFRCGWPVPPETVPVPISLAPELGQWSRIYTALFDLYLDIGGYEHWATSQLHDIKSQIYRDGFQIREKLAKQRECYLWYVQPNEARVCPECSGPMSQLSGAHCNVNVCTSCGLAMGRGIARTIHAAEQIVGREPR
jgi:hypothetical protein